MTRKPSLILLLALLLASAAAHAHKRWLLPTDFTLSETETVTVDFSASNNLFYVDKPMPLAGVSILAPGGEKIAPVNTAEGKRRSSFDLEIVEEGTYRIYDRGEPVYFSSYLLPGDTQPTRARGTLAQLKADVPAAAIEVQFVESSALIETYITLGAETAPPRLTQQGLEMTPVSHPNALYSDEPAQFQFTLDGEPAVGLTVLATPEGTRYRDNQSEIRQVTDHQGVVAIGWSGPGRYLLEATVEKQASAGDIAVRYYNYFLTLEVLAP